MSERRSSRSRHTVKYSGFDDESDDDFANVSPHPAKKPKMSKTVDTASKVSKKSSKGDSWSLDVEIIDNRLMKSPSSNKTRRAPLSEKVYKRELQEALELSLLETEGSQQVVDQNQGSIEFQTEPAMLASGLGDSNNQQFSESATTHAKLKPQEISATKSAPSLGHIPGTIVLDNSIELLEESSSEQPGRQQRPRQAAKKSKVVDSDGESNDESDFNRASDEDEDSADLSDEEEDKRGGKKNKQNLSKLKVNKSTTNVKASLKPVNNRTAKAPKRELETSSRQSCTKPSSSAHVSPRSTIKTSSSSNHPVSQWKPPSRASQNESSLVTVKSPSSGLRLGLSRNQRVKPLHPSVGVV